MSAMRWLIPSLALVSGCVTVDLYRYQARPLPAGAQPRALLDASLREVRGISFRSWRRPIAFDRGSIAPGPDGLTARLVGLNGAPLPPLVIEYREFPDVVQAITERSSTWTVWLGDRLHGSAIEVEIQFTSARAARQFLDAATALAGTPPSRMPQAPAPAPLWPGGACSSS